MWAAANVLRMPRQQRQQPLHLCVHTAMTDMCSQPDRQGLCLVFTISVLGYSVSASSRLDPNEPDTVCSSAREYQMMESWEPLGPRTQR